MQKLKHLFENNVHRTSGIKEKDPDFFIKLFKQQLSVHVLIYGINIGLLHDLDICISKNSEVMPSYNKAISSI